MELAVGSTSSAWRKYFCPVVRSRMATPRTPSRLRSTALMVASSFCHSTCSFSWDACCAQAGTVPFTVTTSNARKKSLFSTVTSRVSAIIRPMGANVEKRQEQAIEPSCGRHDRSPYLVWNAQLSAMEEESQKGDNRIWHPPACGMLD